MKKMVRLICKHACGFVRLCALIMRWISAVSTTGSRVVVWSETWITSAEMALRATGSERLKMALLTFSQNSRKAFTLKGHEQPMSEG